MRWLLTHNLAAADINKLGNRVRRVLLDLLSAFLNPAGLGLLRMMYFRSCRTGENRQFFQNLVINIFHLAICWEAQRYVQRQLDEPRQILNTETFVGNQNASMAFKVDKNLARNTFLGAHRIQLGTKSREEYAIRVSFWRMEFRCLWHNGRLSDLSFPILARPARLPRIYKGECPVISISWKKQYSLPPDCFDSMCNIIDCSWTSDPRQSSAWTLYRGWLFSIIAMPIPHLESVR